MADAIFGNQICVVWHAGIRDKTNAAMFGVGKQSAMGRSQKPALPPVRIQAIARLVGCRYSASYPDIHRVVDLRGSRGSIFWQ
ncbi:MULTISPECIES: hypothetical protein [unclassified Mesorhizobium]|uniref:hypothetical protein n=1 Tax=unclassified Mesorhizobium TaxID=325217 RepID=UPI00112BBA08|nr:MULTISPECIES: hypothetical protein [unclassified Mesorhizobium]TPN39506.1 hypothetical protein FJ976_31755 [Mesorhizobium sp. B1-1-9]TPN41965.1 hypothetical protein FJ978_32590 [Mesorhizobium sp. B1-1-7]